jgi:hypothetical protein
MTNTQPAGPTMESPVLVRLGALALAFSGLSFLLYPVVRPWHDESTIGGAVTSMSSDAWVAAHLFAIFALILMPLGLLGLCRLMIRSRGFGLTVAATVIIWFGAGLSLPYYGAEDFALHALARQVGFGSPLDLLSLVKAIRFGAAAATTFAAGLVLLGVGGVLIAISIWRTAILPRLSGMPLAIALALLIPQFYLPAWARIAHGMQVALALILLAALLWTAARVTAAGLANVSSTTTLTSVESPSMTISVQEAQ